MSEHNDEKRERRVNWTLVVKVTIWIVQIVITVANSLRDN